VDKKKYLVTGANGQLGKELRLLARGHTDIDFFFQSREDMPLENFEMIRTVFGVIKPDVFINCAAYTNVDKAETEKELAFQINGEAVGIIAALCAEANTRLIHISTDYVFDGKGTRPYKETDFTSPVNTYGASKLRGEEQAFAYDPGALVIRTSWVYSSFGKNFVKTMLRLMHERTEIKVVNDQFGSPTYAADLAMAIMRIAAAETVAGGVYHYSNEGAISWFEFAKAIAEFSGAACEVHPIPSTQFPTPADRPAYSVMDKSLIMERFGLELRPWKQSLQQCVDKIIAHPQ
jgi:dTDP-4-dehydrorhamnose reductase